MSARSEYRALFDIGGRRVAIERRIPNAAPVTLAGVRARVMGAQSDELAAGVASTGRRVILLAEDVPATFAPLREGDLVLVDGLRLRLRSVDDQTRRDGEILLAYDCWSDGA